MSVSQPVATDGAQVGAGGDSNPGGRPDPHVGDTQGTNHSTESVGSGPSNSEYLIRAPQELVLETRTDFRWAAATLVDRIPVGNGKLVIDCGSLTSVDSSGLNALILVQRRAASRRAAVVLRNLNDDLRALLVLTKMDDLFEFDMEDVQAR